VKAIWTDFFGVLTPPMHDPLKAFCGKTGLDPRMLLGALKKVAAEYGFVDLMPPADIPVLAEQEWLRQVADELPATDRPKLSLRTVADIWFDGREPNQAWVAKLQQWRRRGLFVGVMSNMLPTWDDYWRRMLPVDELFDGVILSFAVGRRKPQREIYDLGAERGGVRSAECLIVDDTLENCAGARAAGWRAVHFTETADAAAQVDQIISARPSAVTGATAVTGAVTSPTEVIR
jgi:putative hydrolase of the HAD superfamily